MHPKPSSHSGRIVGKQEVIQKRASRQLSGLVTSRHLVRKSSIDEMRVYGYSCCLVLFIASAGTRFAFLSWDSLASSHLWPLPQGQLSPEIGSRGSLRRRSVGIALLVLAIIPFGDMSLILGSGESKSRAFSIHGVTCAVTGAAIVFFTLPGASDGRRRSFAAVERMNKNLAGLMFALVGPHFSVS
jgi:hypothetical protein